ncbi:MAG TPA: hypothetical protein VKG25_09185 [Bryobacteraceae bacterium]|nr:hypothetical protein [Bryobacteraceae bacterium]
MLTKILLPALAVTALAYAESPFACNRLALSPEARVRHFEEVSPALRQLHQSIRELPDGYEFEFAPTATTYQLLSEWTSREYLCCPFFDIDLRISREGGPFWLRLTGREGTKQFIRQDFGRWFPQ